MPRIAILDRDKCKPMNCGIACLKVCPGVKMRQETIVVGEDGIPVIDEDLCTGCGLCVKRCPVGAIKIVNLPEEIGVPSYQFGRNSFRLYGFVLPREKSIVGIIGVNGIGKTTALELMRGAIKPNFGKSGETLSFDEIKKQVRGQEIQNHLEKTAAGKTRFSYKMQHVDKLASSNQTARALLEKCDERKKAAEIAAELELENSIDKRLKDLSGGELQRVAIACCLLRDADVYCIDEPSSYLDVNQRLRAARAIRKLADDGKAVVVIEHDLALLDYLSDYVHVLYGTKGAYGVVSQLKSAKNGVNEYLQGYLRDENVRFRDHQIKFEVRSPEKYASRPSFEYSKVEKTFPGFRLDVAPGKVLEKEVLGIVGPNATGKSTFVKILAGLETPDSKGEGILSQKTVSYKPQYVNADFDGTVLDLLRHAKGFERDIYDMDARSSLELAELEDKVVKNLSGGELQRVAIALALCTPAELYLLDEPSAFLDVEQRLKAAELINKVVKAREKNAFVIDHDIVFVDSVSDRLVVFEGEPGKSGKAPAGMDKREGMNSFLSAFGITFRRDEATGRPRANKPGSQKDQEQKKAGEYYYSE